MKNRNKGITLVALIITIVVMLILVAVSVNVIIKSNLLGTAEKTVNKYKTAAEEEGKNQVIEIDGKKYNSIDEYFKGEEIKIGSYVQYNVPYTDMYSGTDYTATTGWRYLGKDDSGNQLIVSTGIPVILYYSYCTNIGNTADGGENTWWATKAEISATTDTLYKTSKGYDYYKNDGDPNKYAAYGLRHHFDKIQFTYQKDGTSVSTANTGIFRKVGNTTSGANINLNFKAEGVNVVDVHSLTLAELNRATSKTVLDLFDITKWDGYIRGNAYWLATPNEHDRRALEIITDLEKDLDNCEKSNGIRVVVTLPTSVKLTVIK